MKLLQRSIMTKQHPPKSTVIPNQPRKKANSLYTENCLIQKENEKPEAPLTGGRMMELKTFSSVSVFRQKGNAVAAVAGGWLALFALENQQSIGAAFLAVIVIFGIFGVLVVGVERVRVVDYLVWKWAKKKKV